MHCPDTHHREESNLKPCETHREPTCCDQQDYRDTGIDKVLVPRACHLDDILGYLDEVT